MLNSSVMVLGSRSKRRLWSSCYTSSSSSSTSAETIANVEELLTEILARLPIQSLFRFKCVSTYWECLISNPKLCHRYAILNPYSISGVFTSEFSFIPLPLGHDRSSPLNLAGNAYDDGLCIVHSCNGLFLCRSSEAECVDTPPYIVVSPTTNQSLKLEIPTEEKYIIGCLLAFDPSKSPHYKVLCFHSQKIEKVLRFHTTPNSEVFQIHVYSSETRSWRLVSSCFSRNPAWYRHGVYCNGALHWMGDNVNLTYYHIDEERIGFVKGPPQFSQREERDKSYTYFEASSGGHLHLIDIYEPCLTKFQVLEMPGDYSGWFVKYDVDLEPILPYTYQHFQREEFAILLLDENEEERRSSLLMHFPGKVFSFDLKTKSFKSFDLTNPSLTDPELVGDLYHYYHPFMESLAIV